MNEYSPVLIQSRQCYSTLYMQTFGASVEVFNDVSGHIISLSTGLPLFVYFDWVEAAVPHMLVDLSIWAWCQLFGNTQSHIHILLVVADLASLHCDLSTIVQLAFEEDILSKWRRSCSLKGWSGSVHGRCPTSVQAWIVFCAWWTLDRARACIINSKIIVECAFESCRLIEGAKTSCGVWYVGVSSTSIVCVGNTFGLNNW